MENLIVVDIQPEYHDTAESIIFDVIDKLNNTQQNIYFYYVVELSKDKKEDVIDYLFSYGLHEETFNRISFIPKDYGFLRGWMDNNIPDKIIVNTVKHLINNNIQSSEQIDENQLFKLVSVNNIHTCTIDSIYLPNFDIDFIKNNNNFEVIGGGKNECLKEITLILDAYDKKYITSNHLIYGEDNSFNYNTKKKRKY